MGRWAMYRRRGTSTAPAGILILSVVNQGNDTDFLVTFSVPFADTDIDQLPDFAIDGQQPASFSQDDADTIQFILGSPAAASGNWTLAGPLSTITPLLFPQSGSY